LCGRTPLNAVVAALLTIVVVSFYVSLVTRPVVSVLFAVLVFSAVKAGLIAIHGLDLDGRHGLYVAWAIGFLCGFSEPLAQDVAVGASHLLDHSAPAAARPPTRARRARRSKLLDAGVARHVFSCRIGSAMSHRASATGCMTECQDAHASSADASIAGR